MSAAKLLKRGCDLARAIWQEPRQSIGIVRVLAGTIRGSAFAAQWPRPPSENAPGSLQPNNSAALPPNPLLQYFDSHQSGKGIWKWRHYFEIYHRHFAKFVG